MCLFLLNGRIVISGKIRKKKLWKQIFLKVKRKWFPLMNHWRKIPESSPQEYAYPNLQIFWTRIQNEKKRRKELQEVITLVLQYDASVLHTWHFMLHFSYEWCFSIHNKKYNKNSSNVANCSLEKCLMCSVKNNKVTREYCA